MNSLVVEGCTVCVGVLSWNFEYYLLIGNLNRTRNDPLQLFVLLTRYSSPNSELRIHTFFRLGQLIFFFIRERGELVIKYITHKSNFKDAPKLGLHLFLVSEIL